MAVIRAFMPSTGSGVKMVAVLVKNHGAIIGAILFTGIIKVTAHGTPDWVIQAQVGHVDPQMMKTYSHIRRKALDEAAAALEPRRHADGVSVQHSDAPLIG